MTTRPPDKHSAADAAGERPERLLGRLGVASRREVARWLEAGRLASDGHVLKGGERVRPGAKLTLDGRPLAVPEERAARRVLLYNKPEGEIVTRHDPEGRPTVFETLPKLAGGRWVVVGRLDVNTAGLLLFSSDGTLAARLMHPRYEIERCYLVRVHGSPSEEELRRLIRGIPLEDGLARLTACIPFGRPEGSNCWFRVGLTEGRNREVRRLFEAIGFEVSRLKRIAFGPLALPRGLRRGAWQELGAGEIAALDAAVAAPA
ncbi:MAG: pseudouridine synthase, partial [Gammaproteobacteria bacterium]